MILFINTTIADRVEVGLYKNDLLIKTKKIKAARAQAEKLLPLVDRMLRENKLKLKNIKKIRVVNDGGTFTALRIGVVTANALGYALGVPVEGVAEGKKMENIGVVEPIYDGEPNITIKKK